MFRRPILLIVGLCCLLVSDLCFAGSYDTIDQVSQEIKANGPAEVRCLPMNVIEEAVSSLYFEQQAGGQVAEEIEQAGGFANVATESLEAQARGAGEPCLR